MRSRSIWILLCVLAALVSCAHAPLKVNSLAPDQYLQRLSELKSELATKPNNAQLKLDYRQLYAKALRYYLDSGNAYFSSNDYERAIEMFNQGLEIDPANALLRQSINKAKMHLEIQPLFDEALASWKNKDYKTSTKLIDSILNMYPTHQPSKELKQRIEKEAVRSVYKGPNVDLDFDKVDLHSALTFIANSYGFNVVLDSSVKDSQISFHVKDMPLFEALGLLLETTKNTFRVISKNTLLVYSDTKNLRNQYQSIGVKTFYLNSIEAKEMAAILRGVLDIKQVTVNEVNNSITLSEQPHLIQAAASVIERNDVTKGEVGFDVEILEVNLSSSLLAGVDYGAYQIGTQTDPIPVTGSLRDSIQSATTLTIPSVTLNAFKQDVDAKILANPKVRVMDGEKAKIHIGDRVPLRSSDILDATGQTRTTFEYQDIGIRLAVEPNIHTDEKVTIKLALEVSSLGENLGTPEQQAFKIGTRNAETVMLVRDGETAILGGLVKDEERSSSTQVPGLGSIKGLGGMFRNDDRSGSRSDILLTITPRIIRGTATPQSNLETFSLDGTYSEKFAGLKIRPISDPKPVDQTGSGMKVVIDDRPQEPTPKTKPEAVIGAEQSGDQIQEDIIDRAGEFGFGKESYSMDEGESLDVDMSFSDVPQLSNIAFEVVFNPSVVDFKGIDVASTVIAAFEHAVQPEGNVVLIKASIKAGELSGLQNAFKLSFAGKRKGSSYLVIRNFEAEGMDQKSLNMVTNNARIKVR